jgi:hypothetical protein
MSKRKRGPSVAQSLKWLVSVGLIVKQGDMYSLAGDQGKRMIEAWTTQHPTMADEFLRDYLLKALTAGGTTDINPSYGALNALLHHPAGTPCTIDPALVSKELDEAWLAYTTNMGFAGPGLTALTGTSRRH